MRYGVLGTGMAVWEHASRAATNSSSNGVGRSLIVGLERLATDRIHTYRLGAATEALETENLKQKIIETRKPFKRVTGSEELTIEVSGRLLDAGRRVHHVSVIDNRPPATAHFTSDHWPRVQGSAESGHGTELALERRRRLRERSLDREEGGRRPGINPPRGHRPGDHHLVPDILIDLAPVLFDRVRSQSEHCAQEAMYSVGPGPLGKRCGACDVDEEEESLLDSGAVVATEYDVAQVLRADQIAELEH